MRTIAICLAVMLVGACTPADDPDAGTSTQRDTAVPAPDGGPLPDGALPINCVDETGWCPCVERMRGGSFYLFCIAAATYDHAAEACSRGGYRLATLGDPEEHAWAWATSIEAEGAAGDWWIGLDDRASEGRFVWSDGSPLGDYAPWGEGQPDDNANSPTQGEDCVHLSALAEGAFNDLDCFADYLNFICEATP